MADYYDRLLVAIVLAMAGGLAASTHPAVALHQGLAGGSLVSTAVLYEVLFRNPPTEQSRSRRMASVVVVVGWLLVFVLGL
jgi:uncharacterized protein YneF (UPF0154 family)